MVIPRSIPALLLGGLMILDHAAILAFALTGEQITQDLQSQLSIGSDIVFVSQTTLDSNFTARYSISAPPTYKVAVKTGLVDDVQKTVSWFIFFSIIGTPVQSFHIRP